ncbi:MAG: superoxide dismutase, partial [Actinomycetota bacterium]|nr:superoxide dismutase [Actinomycetota bacterium]
DTDIVYGDGFNVNGITTNADATVLLVVHSGTGELFRIDIATRDVERIDLGGELLPNGDGLELDGTTAYAIAGDQLVTIELGDDLRTGTITDRQTLGDLAFPTTLALSPDSFIIVNSQLNMTGDNAQPTIPFSLSVLPRP